MTQKEQSIIFFDGECNLCNSFVQFVLRNEATSKFSFTSLNSRFSTSFFSQKKADFTKTDSVIVYDNDTFYFESEAAFKIISNLKWPHKILLVFQIFPKMLNNFFYKLLAKYRYRIFGKTIICWVKNTNNEKRFL